MGSHHCCQCAVPLRISSLERYHHLRLQGPGIPRCSVLQVEVFHLRLMFLPGLRCCRSASLELLLPGTHHTGRSRYEQCSSPIIVFGEQAPAPGLEAGTAVFQLGPHPVAILEPCHPGDHCPIQVHGPEVKLAGGVGPALRSRWTRSSPPMPMAVTSSART